MLDPKSNSLLTKAIEENRGTGGRMARFAGLDIMGPKEASKLLNLVLKIDPQMTNAVGLIRRLSGEE